MASLMKLQGVINWAKPYLKNQELDLGNQEPALGIGNLIMQTIFSPPFVWRFNRAIDTYQVTKGGPSDVPRYLPRFGQLEDANLLTGATGSTASYPLQRERFLPRPNLVKRPTKVAAVFDDTIGTITFRTDTLPDTAYTLELTYQKSPPALLSLGAWLNPLPDEYDYLFQWGFLSVAGMLVNDARFPIWEKYFLGKLLGLQEGIDEQAISIFLGNWEALTRTYARGTAAYGQGAQGRQQ